MAPRRASHGLLAVLSGFLLLTAGGAAQAPRDTSGGVLQVPVGTASISGVVVSADSGQPLRRARLMLNGQSAGATGSQSGNGPIGSMPGSGTSFWRTTVTDDQGQFTFDGLPAGQFTLDANRDQYLASSYGQKKPGRPGTPIDLGGAQHLQISIPMTRGGVITGMVVDELGEPLMNARVRAMRFVLVNGFRRLRPASEVRTDDRGVYRIFGLEPGEYLVSGTQASSPFDGGEDVRVMFEETLTTLRNAAVARGANPSSIAVPMPAMSAAMNQTQFAPTFYPGVTSPGSAQHVSVDGGVERGGVDIRLLPVRTGIIQGVVSGAPDATTRVQVLLQNTDAAAEPTTLTTNAVATGEFTLAGVQPGSYMVYAQTLPSQPQPVLVNGQRVVTPAGNVRTTTFTRLHGRTPVIVDGEHPSTVVITLAPGRPISGHVTYDLRQAPPRGTPTTISLAPIPQNPQLPAFNTSPQTDVDADGNFTLPGIRPGRYILRASGPGTLKAAMWNGLDTLDVGLEVTADTDVSGVELTMTDRPSTLSGTITNADGKPAMETTIVVAPTNSGLWRNGSRRIATTRPTTDGRYVIRGLPAGEYSLAAVTDIEAGEQFDPEFLRALVGAAVTVTIGDGGTTTQGLRTGR